ncbi:MAG: ABC transporter ATP-binding protein, partial [Clostridia bacterium]|nr:ABC transporter ATP-binding protein [Clostridia bacterium]
GGQKQRIAIARTLMLRCPVMVFDDSLSAVDMETDAEIREALRKNTGSSTVLLISHRINTLMQADKIIVLDEGRIVESGTHAELLANGGLYSRVCAIQSMAYREEDGDNE